MCRCPRLGRLWRGSGRYRATECSYLAALTDYGADVTGIGTESSYFKSKPQTHKTVNGRFREAVQEYALARFADSHNTHPWYLPSKRRSTGIEETEAHLGGKNAQAWGAEARVRARARKRQLDEPGERVVRARVRSRPINARTACGVRPGFPGMHHVGAQAEGFLAGRVGRAAAGAGEGRGEGGATDRGLAGDRRQRAHKKRESAQ
ncbi:hypothetical protein B0H13DRAFT_1867436 [Mycena leptocephala]|nr:hypothetical protein B0H13DRAFT_1867436 [Mycena leptocephala]